MEPVTLTTERLVLSVPRASDVDAVVAACQDDELQRFVPVPVPYTRDDAAGFVDEFVPGSWADDTEYVFAVRAADDELLGVVSWQRSRAAVGYWMAAQHRGHGYLSEALRAVVA
ncbi:MAG: GNAT family N-acetyltransferase, partial [Microcella sp.]